MTDGGRIVLQASFQAGDALTLIDRASLVKIRAFDAKARCPLERLHLTSVSGLERSDFVLWHQV